jgi:lysophospholipase L1-like esterase
MGIRRLAAAVFLLSGCVSGCGGTTTTGKAALPPQVHAKAPVRAPIVMFLGDSYTVGDRETSPERTYAADTARDLGWQVIVGGLGGTGFVAPGAAKEPFDVLFERQLAWRPAPDLLIFSGGHNDSEYAPSTVAAAAANLFTRVQRLWPGTRLLLIGPMAGTGAPDPSILEIRDALQTTASLSKVPFIDPLAAQWITGDGKERTGNAKLFIQPDGVHPNETGHRYLATRLVSDLRRLGLTRPRGGPG